MDTGEGLQQVSDGATDGIVSEGAGDSIVSAGAGDSIVSDGAGDGIDIATVDDLVKLSESQVNEVYTGLKYNSGV